MTKSRVNVALVGRGTVGGALLDIFRRNRPLLEEKCGARLNLAWIVDRRKRPFPGARVTADWREVLKDPSVDIVVELIGGYEPARTLVLAALKAGKHVATANKALLAKHWDEVFRTAQDHKALVYFEAAVGSGIPLIQGLNEGMAANRLTRLYGILNGTTNYILTRMAEEGLSFPEALKGAQKAGFAEADPSFDIEGVDAAHKLAILASLAAGGWVRLPDVSVEGITKIDAWDMDFARKTLNLVTKLLGIAHLDGDKVSARVHPALISAHHPFANVGAEYNAVIVHGDAAGDVMFYGRGAGGPAAASAVASDVVYLARQVANGTAGQIPYVATRERRIHPSPMDRVVCRHYLRFMTQDKPGVLAQIAAVLGRHGISIASVHQDARAARAVPIVIVTHRAPEGAVKKALAEADRLPAALQKARRLRIEDFL